MLLGRMIQGFEAKSKFLMAPEMMKHVCNMNHRFPSHWTILRMWSTVFSC